MRFVSHRTQQNTSISSFARGYTKTTTRIQGFRLGYSSEESIVATEITISDLKPQPSMMGSSIRIDGQGNPIVNRILNAIPESEFENLRGHLELAQFTYHQSMHESAEEIEYAYFLNKGMVSLVVVTTDGRSVEVGIVGKEGWVGAPLSVGMDRSPYRAMVQIPGNGMRIKSRTLLPLLDSSPQLRLMLNRYSQIQGMQVAQLAACNRLHEIEKRLARWMLMCQDRVESDLLPMTHEFFAQMLGAGRPSVTLAAGVLQRAGIIRYSRGKVTILNRKGLEDAACECYRVIQRFDGNQATNTQEVENMPDNVHVMNAPDTVLQPSGTVGK
jgi:CRP-like cAMP-binding protein